VTQRFPEIEEIRRQMAEARTNIQEAEIEIVKKEGEVAANQVENAKLGKVADELEALKSDQDAGIIRGEFEATVSKAYNQWGFVVINAGNDQGVVHHAQLDVFRRGQYLCKLLVTQVETNQSVADIIPGSLQPGQAVAAGDIVVKAVKAAPVQPKPDEGDPLTAPAPKPADPFGGGGGEPDPFGGGGEPDPFGGGGGTMQPDPFGGGGAPDPFGQ
jgi:hypothetical protein